MKAKIAGVWRWVISVESFVEFPRRTGWILPWIRCDTGMRGEAELIRISGEEVLLCLLYTRLVSLFRGEVNNWGLREQRNR